MTGKLGKDDEKDDDKDRKDDKKDGNTGAPAGPPAGPPPTDKLYKDWNSPRRMMEGKTPDARVGDLPNLRKCKNYCEAVPIISPWTRAKLAKLLTDPGGKFPGNERTRMNRVDIVRKIHNELTDLGEDLTTVL